MLNVDKYGMIKGQEPWRDNKKGECIIQYVYKPYHGWRHGYRRERICRWIIRAAKVMLVLEGVILTVRYLKQHTYEKVYERELYWMEDAFSGEDMEESMNLVNPDESLDHGTKEELYGIGIGTEDGSLFWFHKTTEEMEKEP